MSPCCRSTASITRCINACAAGGWRKSNASGLRLRAGRFAILRQAEFASITVEQALNHPTWKMGQAHHDRLGDADE